MYTHVEEFQDIYNTPGAEIFTVITTGWWGRVCGKADNLERPYLLLLCGIVCKVIRWTLCEQKCDLLYFLDICSNIMS